MEDKTCFLGGGVAQLVVRSLMDRNVFSLNLVAAWAHHFSDCEILIYIYILNGSHGANICYYIWCISLSWCSIMSKKLPFKLSDVITGSFVWEILDLDDLGNSWKLHLLSSDHHNKTAPGWITQPGGSPEQKVTHTDQNNINFLLMPCHITCKTNISTKFLLIYVTSHHL